MQRQTVLLSVVWMEAILLPAAAPGQAAAKNRLNVLLIVSEDTGVHFGCYGDRTVSTPHLDRLAAEGIRFERAYVTTASCSESRSSIFTGLYPHQNGQIGLATHRYSMFRPWPTIPSLLKQAGYRTGILGKLHVNPESAFPFDVWWRPPEFCSFAHRDGRYKLIVSLLADRGNPTAACYVSPAMKWTNLTAADVAAAPAETREVFSTWANAKEELYDLQADPLERQNLAASPEAGEIRRRLRAALEQWQRETGDPLADPKRLARLTAEHDAVAKGYEEKREFTWQYHRYIDRWGEEQRR